jgi:hypothetical protein
MPVTIDGTNGITTPDLESSGAITLGSSVLSVPSGSAPSYTCRAWVNFNGTGTVAIRASGNVSSITDGGVGIYTVNLATAMPDADYATVVGASRTATDITIFSPRGAVAQTASSTALVTANSVLALTDSANVYVAIFR